MTIHYSSVQVVIDPDQSDALQGGGRLQDVSLILTDTYHASPGPVAPAAVALLACQARDLAFELLSAAEHADEMRTQG
jgi:hypothetical protein